MRQPEQIPQRRKLPHALPPWVRQGTRHFITVNCGERGTCSLCRDDVATQLLNSARYYDEIGRWHLWLMVVMPDHLHLIATFDLERGVQATLRSWKGYQKRTLHIEWQADFFEHRIRDDSEFTEKMYYVRMNPVRKGLVSSPDMWPYILDRTGSPQELGMIAGRAKPPAEPLALGLARGSAGRLAPPRRAKHV